MGRRGGEEGLLLGLIILAALIQSILVELLVAGVVALAAWIIGRHILKKKKGSQTSTSVGQVNPDEETVTVAVPEPHNDALDEPTDQDSPEVDDIQFLPESGTSPDPLEEEELLSFTDLSATDPGGLESTKYAVEQETLGAIPTGHPDRDGDPIRASGKENVRLERLAEAVDNGTLDGDILADSCGDGLRDTDYDWRQDVLDYVAAVHEMARYRNRYSAMQSATFIANMIIREYLEADDGSLNFLEFVRVRCGEMLVKSPPERLVLQYSRRLVPLLEDGADQESIARYLEEQLGGADGVPPARSRSSHRIPGIVRPLPKSHPVSGAVRPLPEDICPPVVTDDPEIESFSRLAKALTHMRLRHLGIGDDDIDEVISEAAGQYREREWKSFRDFFTNGFQFAHLTETRFERVYRLLSMIASAKAEGLTEVEILKKLGDVRVLDPPRKSRPGQAGPTSVDMTAVEDDAGEGRPYHPYTDEEHTAIRTAARVTRELRHDRIFRRTFRTLTGFIDRYHSQSGDGAMSERQFIGVSASFLKGEDPQMSNVCDVIMRISDLAFSGMDGERIWDELLRNELRPFLCPAEEDKSSKPVRPLSYYALSDLRTSISECGLSQTVAGVLVSLAEELDRECPGPYSTAAGYYRAMRSAIRGHRETPDRGRERRVLDYILQCKINSVPDVSLMALVGTRFPSLYRKHARGTGKRRR